MSDVLTLSKRFKNDDLCINKNVLHAAQLCWIFDQPIMCSVYQKFSHQPCSKGPSESDMVEQSPDIEYTWR